jgi:hypothetical protein
VGADRPQRALAAGVEGGVPETERGRAELKTGGRRACSRLRDVGLQADENVDLQADESSQILSKSEKVGLRVNGKKRKSTYRPAEFAKSVQKTARFP